MREIEVWIRHEVCPFCGSRNITEFKPNWGLCDDCLGQFHMETLVEEAGCLYAFSGCKAHCKNWEMRKKYHCDEEAED